MCVYVYGYRNKFSTSLIVSSLLLTPTLFAIGLYSGEICVYHTPTFLESREEATSVILHGHFRSVYALHCLKGRITADGSTSLFPTYLGRPTEEVERDYLISVGYGRGYPSLRKNNVFRKSSPKKGCFINAWML